MSRPQTLAEAAAVSLAGNKPFGHAVDELLDEFYLHPDVRQARIDDAPVSMGDALRDPGSAPSANISRVVGDCRCPCGRSGRSTSG
jgi:hypothetical protein